DGRKATLVVIPFIMWLPGMVSIFNKLVLSRRWHLFGSTQREARENCKRVKGTVSLRTADECHYGRDRATFPDNDRFFRPSSPVAHLNLASSTPAVRLQM